MYDLIKNPIFSNFAIFLDGFFMSFIRIIFAKAQSSNKIEEVFAFVDSNL